MSSIENPLKNHHKKKNKHKKISRNASKRQHRKEHRRHSHRSAAEGNTFSGMRAIQVSSTPIQVVRDHGRSPRKNPKNLSSSHRKIKLAPSTTSIVSQRTFPSKSSLDSSKTATFSVFPSRIHFTNRQHAPTTNPFSEPMDRNVSDHISKIRSFIRQQVKNDICHADRVFESIRGLMPRNASRNAFDMNPDKCRHPDVICVDHDRVMLNCVRDFIHANRVLVNEDGTGELILTQLPLKNTVMDFWRMVWDENVQSILVILTQAEWNHFGKKLRLIPDWRGCLHKREGLCVSFQQEFSVSPLWSVTFYGVSWGGSHRSIQWIHYTGWAHGQAPNETTTIWQINSYLRRSKRPIVCLSMSGAGRAGTYAMLEVAHERLHNRNNKRISLAECLQKVRDTRMHAVQTRAQFSFLQIALVDHLMSCERVRLDVKSDHIARYKQLRLLKMNNGNGCLKETTCDGSNKLMH